MLDEHGSLCGVTGNGERGVDCQSIVALPEGRNKGVRTNGRVRNQARRRGEAFGRPMLPTWTESLPLPGGSNPGVSRCSPTGV
jgi:hypothetical protein